MKTLHEYQIDSLIDIDTLTSLDGRYRLMSVEKQVELAELFIEKCAGYERILVVETGASPLARIMQEMARKKGKEVEFYAIKITRETTSDQFPSLLARYLNLSDFISEPFLIFDEYLDSGHTIKLVLSFLRWLSCKEHFRIMVYMNFSDDAEMRKLIHYCCADNVKKQEIFTKTHFSQHVYPFENRLEYAPYFYYEGVNVSLLEFVQESASCNHRFSFDEDLINRFLNKVKEQIEIACIADFLTKEHLILYSFYCMENDPIRKEFFWLVFDSVGPFWTPLPKEYHFSYWRGFDAIHEEFDACLKLLSPMNLQDIASQLSRALLNKYDHWSQMIKETINRSL